MKGTYEHRWQEAMSGASIEPSEALWSNIASKMDADRGRNYWVTLLMIAATVTMAFALPLTMGSLDYQSRPDMQFKLSDAAQTEKTINNEQSVISNNEITNHDNQLSNNTQIQTPKTQNLNEQLTNSSITSNQNTKYPNAQTPKLQIAKDNSQTPISNVQVTSNTNFESQNTKTPKHQIAADYKGVRTLNNLGNAQLAEIESYYMVPYFMPVNKDKDAGNNLLASVNMGTGNVSNKPGFAGSKRELFFDNVAASPDPTKNGNYPIRTQNAGTAFYVGGGVELPLGKRWSLLTGLGYRLQNADGFNNMVTEQNGVYKPLGIYAPVTSGTTFLSDSYNYTVSNHYLSMPISFKYPFINRRFKWRAGLGVSTDLMLAHKVSSASYGSATYKPADQGYQPILFAGVISMDISYNLTNQYAIAFETGFRKGFTPVDEEKEFYPSSFSAGIIIFYKIK